MQDKVAKLCGSKAELIGEATQTDLALVTKQFRGKGVKVNLQLDMLYAHSIICHNSSDSKDRSRKLLFVLRK